MKKEPQRKDKSLTIPFKMVTAIMLGIIILLSVYIYSNYVVAAPVLHLPDTFHSGVDSNKPSQSVPELIDSHESRQESLRRQRELLTGLLYSL
ncbi:hypothetical protein [Pantoea agglomerans]|uniref:hypothetical protein n=1 Tax=Enterobacter agglomerans TaxID=549 RepID=UPI0013C85B5E|nr:hypothetical protein [Pantoea agglomerans]NEG60607.1 hypothetical protein [Pantoea agglomerans]NEH05288.1 hypothetical protein [Pantoea agglomerans]